MTFLRLLLLAAIICLLYYLYRKLVVKKNAGGKSLETTRMVRCGYCNVYIVRQDAYFRNNHYYCSADHYEKRIRENTE